MARKPRRRSASSTKRKGRTDPNPNLRTREQPWAERWQELGFVDATDEGAGFVIGAPGPTAKTKSTPVYGMWEYWVPDADGVRLPTMVAVRWTPGEAWALINGAWQRVDSAVVGNEARMLDKESYDSFFRALIALPVTAFQ